MVVVGGGRESLSAARRALKKGASEVTVLTTVPLERLGLGGVFAKEAQVDGVTVRQIVGVDHLTGTGDKLTGLAYNASSREVHHMPVDGVILAGGRLPDMIVRRIPPEPVEGQEEAPVVAGSDTKWETVMPYGLTAGRPRDMFSLKDALSDHRAAVEAIGAGRRAAATIHKLYWGEEPVSPADWIGQAPIKLDVARLENLVAVGPRQDMPEISGAERVDVSREIALGLSEDAARAEASRCLNCGLICYYRTKYN